MPKNHDPLLRYKILVELFKRPQGASHRESIEIVQERLSEFGKTYSKSSFDRDLRHLRHDFNQDIVESQGRYTLDKDSPRLFDHPLLQHHIAQIQAGIASLLPLMNEDLRILIEEGLKGIKPHLSDPADERTQLLHWEPNHHPEVFKKMREIVEILPQKKWLEIEYEPFGKSKEQKMAAPLGFKEYNKRWYLVAANKAEKDRIEVYALDRLRNFKLMTEKNELFGQVHIAEHFEDIIGVTKEEATPVTVRLKFKPQRLPYVLTKPLHPSQKQGSGDLDDGSNIRIEVIPNKELYQTLLSFGDDIEVMGPESVRTEFVRIVRAMFDSHQD